MRCPATPLVKHADLVPVQEGHAPAVSSFAGGPLLPQSSLPLRGVHSSRLVYYRPPVLYHQAVSAHEADPKTRKLVTAYCDDP